MAHIKTYLRIKPSNNPYDDFENSQNTIYFRVPETLRADSATSMGSRTKVGGTINHEFRFNQIFGQDASQEQVFDTSAKSIVDGKN